MNALPAAAMPTGRRTRSGHAPRPARPPLRLVGDAPPRPAQRIPPRPAHGAPLRHARDAPLRLTRRGRVVVAAVVALLVTMLSLLAAGVAQATSHGPSPGAARQNLVQVVVRPGQSLWSVAESADPDQDTRAVIRQIIDLNALSGDVVFAGQQLWVPRG